MLRRVNFYSAIQKSPIFETYHLESPKLTREETLIRYYSLDWNFLERFTNLPVFSQMLLTQDRKHSPLEQERNAALETIIYGQQIGLIPLDAFAREVDNTVEEVHPKLVSLYRVGPFYNQHTQNSSEMNAILEKSNELFVLKFTIERVLSERQKNHYDTFWNRVRGRKTVRESFGPVDSETKMIVPFRLKQDLKNRDEYGNPCKVYGVTNAGEIIG